MTLSNIGLIFDIVGVVLLFFFGPPIPDVFLDGSEIIVTSPDSMKAKKAKIKNNISKLALGVIVIGFSLQLAGNICNSNYQDPIDQQLKDITKNK